MTTTTPPMQNHAELLRVTQSITNRYPYIRPLYYVEGASRGYHYRYSVGRGGSA